MIEKRGCDIVIPARLCKSGLLHPAFHWHSGKIISRTHISHILVDEHIIQSAELFEKDLKMH